MGTVKIGRLAVEIPDATLGDVEDAAALEDSIKAAAERKDFAALIDGYLGVVLVMARSENADLTLEKMRRALPFRPGKRLEAASQAYRDALVASGVAAEGGAQGEAERP